MRYLLVFFVFFTSCNANIKLTHNAKDANNPSSGSVLGETEAVNMPAGETPAFDKEGADKSDGGINTDPSKVINTKNSDPIVSSPDLFSLLTISDKTFENRSVIEAETPIDTIVFAPPSASGIIFTCSYKKVSHPLDAARPCSDLPGVADFNTATGKLNWDPGSSIKQSYKVSVAGSRGSHISISEFVLQITDLYRKSSLILDLDAQFADGLKTMGNEIVWQDLKNFQNQISVLGTSRWQGAGAATNPAYIQFAQSLDVVDLGVGMNDLTESTFSGWFRFGNIATERVSFIRNMGTDSKFKIQSSAIKPGTLEWGFGTYQAAVIATGPIAYWRFSEPAGSTSGADLVSGRVMTYVNSPTLETSGGLSFDSDKAISLNGTDQRLSSIDDDLFDFGTNQNFTVSVWIKAPFNQVNTSGVSNEIIAKWSSGTMAGYPFAIRIYNQNHADAGKIYALRFDGTNSPSVISTTAVNDNSFHNVVFTKDGANLKLYIDGRLEDTKPDTTTGDTTNTFNLFVGQKAGAVNLRYSGGVDDLVIWDRKLTQIEIEDQFAIGAGCRSSSTILADEWYNIAGTYDGGSAKLYIDGALQCSVRISPAKFRQTASLLVGPDATDSSPWTGGMATFRAYNAASDAGTVLSDFQLTKWQFK